MIEKEGERERGGLMLVVVYVCSLANIDHTRNLFDVLINLKTGLEITLFVI